MWKLFKDHNEILYWKYILPTNALFLHASFHYCRKEKHFHSYEDFLLSMCHSTRLILSIVASWNTHETHLGKLNQYRFRNDHNRNKQLEKPLKKMQVWKTNTPTMGFDTSSVISRACFSLASIILAGNPASINMCKDSFICS